MVLSLFVQFLNKVIPFTILVPKVDAVFAKVNWEVGAESTIIFKEEELCCPLLLFTFKLAEVKEVGALYVTTWGPMPEADIGLAPVPKFQVYVAPANVELDVLTNVTDWPAQIDTVSLELTGRVIKEDIGVWENKLTLIMLKKMSK